MGCTGFYVVRESRGNDLQCIHPIPGRSDCGLTPVNHVFKQVQGEYRGLKKIPDIGSRFVPDENMMEIYKAQMKQ